MAAKLSQKQLGIQASIDQFVASTRINRYELGVHKPDFLKAQNLARVQGISASFLYAPEDEIAELLRYCHAGETERLAVHELLAKHPGPPAICQHCLFLKIKIVMRLA